MRRHSSNVVVISTLIFLFITLFCTQITAALPANNVIARRAAELADGDGDNSTSTTSSSSSSTSSRTSTTHSTTHTTTSSRATTTKATEAPPDPTHSSSHTTPRQPAPTPTTTTSRSEDNAKTSQTSTSSSSSVVSSTAISLSLPLSSSVTAASLSIVLPSLGSAATTLSLQAIYPPSSASNTQTAVTGAVTDGSQEPATNAASKGFLDNKGAVIGTFVPVGLVGTGLIVFVIFMLRRAHKRRKERQDEEEFYQEQRNFGFGDEHSFSKGEESGNLSPSSPPVPQITVNEADDSFAQTHQQMAQISTDYFPTEHGYNGHPYATSPPPVIVHAPQADYNPYADNNDDANAYGGATVEDRTSQYINHESGLEHDNQQRSDYPYSTEVPTNKRDSIHRPESSSGDHSVGTAY